ncbi:MAG: GAF domain-containing protein, partial [Planctomycetes bacterium]|nr:GAF domain-containing protein [Planctomycetota bacterium]
DTAGLDLVKFIREELGNRLIRIILRTGYPGYAPEKEVVMAYDINEYKTKTELTFDTLFTMVISNLRAYKAFKTIAAYSLDLKQQIKDRAFELTAANQKLKNEIIERKQAEETLRQSERELSLRNKIAHIFLTSPDEEMYKAVLGTILESLKSEYGVFGYIDQAGSLVCPSMTKDIWDQCQMSDKEIVFPRDAWGGIWGRALIEKKALYSNESFRVPEGHIPVLRALDAPIIHQGKLIGNFLVGNKATDYDQQDIQLLEAIASYVAPVLNARLQRDRQKSERQQAEQALHKSEER